MKTRLTTAFIGWLITSSAFAQEAATDAIPEPLVKRTIIVLLQQIHLTPCGLSGTCEPATAEELENPPIPISDARKVIQSGVASGTAQWCEMNWQTRIFRPMIVHLRDVQKWNERQLALAGLIHGVFQAQALDPLKATGNCPLLVRAELERKLPRW